jgi:hypothetical protein
MDTFATIFSLARALGATGEIKPLEMEKIGAAAKASPRKEAEDVSGLAERREFYSLMMALLKTAPNDAGKAAILASFRTVVDRARRELERKPESRAVSFLKKKLSGFGLNLTKTGEIVPMAPWVGVMDVMSEEERDGVVGEYQRLAEQDERRG